MYLRKNGNSRMCVYGVGSNFHHRGPMFIPSCDEAQMITSKSANSAAYRELTSSANGCGRKTITLHPWTHLKYMVIQLLIVVLNSFLTQSMKHF